MADTVVGIFRDVAHAEQAMHDLRTVGFPASSLTLSPADQTPDGERKLEAHDADETYTTQGAMVGTVAIGTIGAAMGFSGEHLSPQVPVLNNLPSSVFTMLLMGLAGWLAGGIIGLGVSKAHGAAIAPGTETALAVRAPGRVEEARAILRYNGVLDVRGADAAELAARA